MLFDLDGTLIDSAPGILRCIRHAFDAIGRSRPADDVLHQWIGPPLNDTFRAYFDGDDELAARAVRAYRARYADDGWRECRLIAGVDPLLKRLKATGARSYVVTSKPAVVARRIVAHLGLEGCFERVCGSEPDGSGAAKTGLIAALLADAKLPLEAAVMIGDRRHDVEGARANGIAVLGVTWGYGSRGELEAAGADAIAASPYALERLILN